MELSYNYQIECNDNDLVAIMKQFTEVDLNNNLITDNVFQFFSNDVIFIWNGYQAGYTVGWYFFKIRCEYNFFSIDSNPDISIIDKGEYVVWKFSCMQTRRYKFLPLILSPPKRYTVNFEANLYFNNKFEINKFEIISSDKNERDESSTLL